MCRWIAYRGPEIPVSLPLIDAEHSLLIQSSRSELGVEPMNGDGFGVGWYAHGLPTPALFRDVRPAWNDENFRDLATHTRSSMFLAHIRATTGTSVQRSNCHPFRSGRWLFQHNGLIPDFEVLKDLDPALVFPAGSIVVVSEPLADLMEWEEVRPGTLIKAGTEGVAIREFEPC